MSELVAEKEIEKLKLRKEKLCLDLLLKKKEIEKREIVSGLVAKKRN